MKKQVVLLLIAFLALNIQAQKLKGNKIVTIEERELDPFYGVLVSGNLKVNIAQKESGKVIIETDENLHEAIETRVVDGILEVELIQKIYRKKVLNISINVTNEIEYIETRDKATLTGTSEIRTDSLSLLAKGNSKMNLSISTEKLLVNGQDRSTMRLNVENHADLDINLVNHAEVFMQVTSEAVFVDISNDSSLRINGNANDLMIFSIDNSNFKGKDFLVDFAKIDATNKSDTTVNVAKELSISAVDKSEIYIYGEPVYFIDKFIDKAILYRK